jgi:hypothetical protein
MQSLDPSTGPIPRDEFVKLVNAPYGEALKGIRKYDPLWGRQPGEKIKWKVKCRTVGIRYGEAEVEATSEQHAKKLAENLTYDEVEWDWDEDDFEIVKVEAAE